MDIDLISRMAGELVDENGIEIAPLIDELCDRFDLWVDQKAPDWLRWMVTGMFLEKADEEQLTLFFAQTRMEQLHDTCVRNADRITTEAPEQGQGNGWDNIDTHQDFDCGDGIPR